MRKDRQYMAESAAADHQSNLTTALQCDKCRESSKPVANKKTEK
jgi:hypothetical protein